MPADPDTLELIRAMVSHARAEGVLGKGGKENARGRSKRKQHERKEQREAEKQGKGEKPGKVEKQGKLEAGADVP
jgi:hypothetical protein